MIYIHNINPVFLSIGSLKIYYYSFAYVFGMIFIPWYLNKMYFFDKKLADSFSIYIAIGVILGGRIFYVIFYDLFYYLLNASEIFKIWNGGMSFHGGFIGYILSCWIFSKKFNKSFLRIIDYSAISAALCLGIGRVMNFINGELYGRFTNGKWGVIFPNCSHQRPRHPSQLYEAFCEGFILYFILYSLSKKTKILQRPGLIGFSFVIGYGFFRFLIEFFREPDYQIGFVIRYFTMGQILCLLMIISGSIGYFILNKKNKLLS